MAFSQILTRNQNFTGKMMKFTILREKYFTMHHSCKQQGRVVKSMVSETFQFQLFPSPLVGPWAGPLLLHALVSSVEERITSASQVAHYFPRAATVKNYNWGLKQHKCILSIVKEPTV